MGVLKGFSLGILSFLLFLSLTVFGVVYTINSTVLNPKFLSDELDKVDVSALASEIIAEQADEGDFPQELRTAMIDTIEKLESPVKEQVGAAIDDSYDYLLGERETPDLAGTLGDTFFNSGFVTSLMDELDLAQLTEEVLRQQFAGEGFSDELMTALVNTITENEAQIKEGVAAASDPVFDYLLQETQSINLAQLLKDNVLTSDFIISLLEELDVASLSTAFLTEELSGQLTEDMEFLADDVETAVAEIEPSLQAAVTAAANPILDYLLGESQSFSVVISLTSVKAELEETLKDSYMENLPPEKAELSQEELDQDFEDFYTRFCDAIPSTFEIDEGMFPSEVSTQFSGLVTKAEEVLQEARQSIAEGITEAEESLEQARKYVGWFQLGFKILIGVMALLIIGIILIYREVKGATRSLSIAFLIYGAIEYAGILISKNLAGEQLLELLAQEDIPASLQRLPAQLINDFSAPLQMYSLIVLIVGVVLLVTSFVYPRLRKPVSAID